MQDYFFSKCGPSKIGLSSHSSWSGGSQAVRTFGSSPVGRGACGEVSRVFGLRRGAGGRTGSGGLGTQPAERGSARVVSVQREQGPSLAEFSLQPQISAFPKPFFRGLVFFQASAGLLEVSVTSLLALSCFPIVTAPRSSN